MARHGSAGLTHSIPFLVATAAASAAAKVVASLNSGLVFIGWLVTGAADMALPVAGFISLKVVEGLRATLRYWPMIAIARVVTVVDVAKETTRAMEPRTRSNEESVDE